MSNTNDTQYISLEQKNQLLEIIVKQFKSILLDKKHLQIIFGLSASSINRMISNSQISYVKLGNSQSQVKFLATDIVELIFDNRVQSFQSNIKGGFKY